MTPGVVSNGAALRMTGREMSVMASSKKQFHVYVMASRSRTLYVGVTSDLEKRVYEHKHKLCGGFTSRYNIDRLVYLEECGDSVGAIAREKQIKAWARAKKVALIELLNPTWEDLSKEWFGKADSSLRSE